MIPYKSDDHDRNHVLAMYGPILGYCSGGRLILPGYVCPHCRSGDPREKCDMPKPEYEKQ